MVNTVKFSQFAVAPLTNPDNEVVGLENGVNVQSERFLTWTSATRPLMPFNGLLGLNTDLEAYEFWNSVTSQWVQFLDSSSGLDWSVITSVSENASVNNGYIANRSITPVTILLPATFSSGDIIEIMGLGTGGWSLVSNSGQIIQWASVSTSMAGAINSDIQYANITVRGLLPNTIWSVISVNSNPSYV